MIALLPGSPSGQVTHGQVRDKINEIAAATNTVVGNIKLMAASYTPLASIQPTTAGIANKKVVTYGLADGLTDVSSPGGEVTIRADGVTELKTEDQFWALVYYRFGRTGASGTSQLGFFSEISPLDELSWIPQSFPLPGDVSSTTEFKTEVLAAPVYNSTGGTLYIRQAVMRGLNGNNSGGIFREDWGKTIVTANGNFTYSPGVEIQWWRTVKS